MDTAPPQIGLEEPATPTETPPTMRPPLPLSSSAPTATKTLIMNHPSAKLASSPASSPRIIDPPLDRKESIHLSRIDYMENGIAPGADFFDDQSSGSEWEDEDDEKMEAFPDFDREDVGLGRQSLLHENVTKRRKSRSKRKSKDECMITALPAYPKALHNGPDSGVSPRQAHRSFQVYGRPTTRARHMSFTRLSRDNVKVVHNHGSTSGRSSLTSHDTDETASQFPKSSNSFRHDNSNLDTSAGTTQHNHHGHNRSSTSESMIADSIINAHFNTMRALKALSPSSTSSQPADRSFLHSASTDFPLLPSFSNGRRVNLSPISVADRDHLPSHFVKTPYPFTAKKEFPKPATRPRNHNPTGRLDSGYGEGSMNEFDDRKGKHVLGLMPSDGSYDLRSRIERNEDAQGLIRTSSPPPPTTSTLWLSLTKNSTTSRRLARIDIPSTLVILPNHTAHPTDFDDTHLVTQLHAAHASLAGSRLARLFSARKLSHIQLAHLNTWSADTSLPSPSRLLAARAGTDVSRDAGEPFTEDALMALYREPRRGKARYTWVHWAQRVAASSSAREGSHSAPQSHANSPARSHARTQTTACSPPRASEKGDHAPDVVTTVQFVHVLSTVRILLAVCLVLGISAGACLLWVFLGAGGAGERGGRVVGGVCVGALVLAMQGLGLGVWVARS